MQIFLCLVRLNLVRLNSVRLKTEMILSKGDYLVMTKETVNDDKKLTLLSYVSILFALAGTVLGYFDKATASGGFGLGMIAAFVSVLVSLMSVKDHGHNVLAKIAFFAANASLFASVALSAVQFG